MKKLRHCYPMYSIWRKSYIDEISYRFYSFLSSWRMSDGTVWCV